MRKVHIFIRKKNSTSHHSVERFVKILSKYVKGDNLEVRVLICPFISKGLFRRILLIIWAFFKQGNVNHISGDISFISLFMKKKKNN